MTGCNQKKVPFTIRILFSIPAVLLLACSAAALAATPVGIRDDNPGSTVPGLSSGALQSHAGSVTACEIVQPSALLTGDYADGRLHDFLLENDRIAVVIGDIDHPVHYALSGGNIIDAGSSSDRVDANNESGQIYLQMETGSAGDAGATLPPGAWRLVASADKYEQRETGLVVEEGSLDRCDFLLPADSDLRDIRLYRPAGDTLTVIQRPLVNIPALVREGGILDIDCAADPAASGWAAMLKRGNIEIPLEVADACYDPSTLWWRVSCPVPEVPLYELYDLLVSADGGIEDAARNAVKVMAGFKEDWYFIHITDTHLPTQKYNTDPGFENDTSEETDLRAVLADINIINPEFVLLTGDFVNEGELEEYLNWRVFTRGQAMLSEFPAPVFLTAGNHDIGGWDDTPPPDGTARRDWWRFFGWKRLDVPPPGAPWFTQNYSFDYGPVHFVGLESYDNYDEWRYDIYGRFSFTQGQLQWLQEDLDAASGSAAQVLFYHYDFKQELDLDALGVEGALWGHTHSNEGNINHRPFDLGTNNVCGGKRSYRLVRVSGGSALQPGETLSAGSYGQKITVGFAPANNGLHDDVTATITNDQDQRFENGLLKFVMPKGYGGEVITGGVLLQVDDSGEFAVYYVGVDILELSVQTVNIRLDPGRLLPPAPSTVNRTGPAGGVP